MPDWRVPLVIGILNLIAAIVILVEPHGTLTAITVVAGIYLLLLGIVIAAGGFSLEPTNWGVVALGVLAILGGIFVIIHPGSTLHGVRIVLGIYLVIAGVWRLLVGFKERGDQGRDRDLINGAIDLVAGLVLLFAPSLGLTAVAIIFGIYLILRGLLDLWVAWTSHKLAT